MVNSTCHFWEPPEKRQLVGIFFFLVFANQTFPPCLLHVVAGSRSSNQLPVQQLVPGDHRRASGRHEPGPAGVQPADHHRPLGTERSAGPGPGRREHPAAASVAREPAVGHGVAHQLPPGRRHGRLQEGEKHGEPSPRVLLADEVCLKA